MKKNFSITSKELPEVVLRTIEIRHQDNLRKWKNDNREWFFYKEVIPAPSQLEWFNNYLSREKDFMFIVKTEMSEIGCMGIRELAGRWDLYNVILGLPEYAKKGIMSRALKLMCSFACKLMPVPITAKVIINNPAIRWYSRNAFLIKNTFNEFVEIELDLSRFVPCALEVFDGSRQIS